MSRERMLEVLQMYADELSYVEPKRENEGGTRREHLRWMCLEAQRHIEKNEMEKANRWLGFIQGSFWMFATYSIDEMREHNRPY